MIYDYLDFSDGLKLGRTDDAHLVLHGKRLLLGKNLTDTEIINVLRGGIIGSLDWLAREDAE